MKIIEPSVILTDIINPADIYEKLERCGRVCYQSQPKGNAEDFVRLLIKRGHESVLEHVSLTFHIICDRAIQNELVRHRHTAFSVESTRFVKYDDSTFIKPTFKKHSSGIVFKELTEHVERAYREMLSDGEKPEIARSVLPLCTKSELFMTTNLREWRSILKLRTSDKAHPQMRIVANKILAIFKDKLPVIVEDFSNDNPTND